MSAHPHYWLGSLAMAAALATQKNRTPREARQILLDALAKFVVSPVPSEHLRNELRREMRG